VADEIGKFYRQARGRGGVAVTQANRLIFGTRRDPNLVLAERRDASVQLGRVAALGGQIKGLSTVWNGPARAAQPGAPVLRRARP
jgi:hypothetical protein